MDAPNPNGWLRSDWFGRAILDVRADFRLIFLNFPRKSVLAGLTWVSWLALLSPIAKNQTHERKR
jgi:hypothetical protein